MLQSSFSFNKTVHLSWITPNISNIQFADSNYNATDWILVNIQQTEYYRVHYDVQSWQKLLRYLNSENFTKIHILNRAKIIDDAFYFFLQRELSYNFFWNLTSFVIRDANFVTWYPMIKVFESFACLYPLEYGYEITKDVNDRINQLLTKIGYTEKPTDHTLTIYLREEAVKWACMLDTSANECQEVATSKFNKEFQNSVENNNLAGKKWIYCNGLKTANYTIWYTIWQKWKATSDENYLEYLTCTEKYDIICAFLRLILLENVQPNDSKWATRRANAFLFTVAKHAKIKEVNSCLIQILKDINFSSNRRNDIIATLIVIITHIDAVHHVKKIMAFASNYQLVRTVRLKIKKRRLEYGNLTRNYYYYFSSP
nr:PREDICTED: aminopeptidase N-like [Linepithema humile]